MNKPILSPRMLLISLLITLSLAILPAQSQEATAEVTSDVQAQDANATATANADLTLTAVALTATAQAQATQTAQAQLTVSGSEPARMGQGNGGQLSIFGTNFTADTTVRLQGFGLLSVTFINSGALTAAVPANIPAGVYTITVSDPNRGSQDSPQTLTIVAPPAPPPTQFPTLAPLPTFAPPTPIPGTPNLIVASYSASPAVVAPGGSVRFNVQVRNQGTRTAQGVTVMLDASGSLIPIGGESTALLPDIAPNGTANLTVSATVAQNASAGPVTGTLNMTYRDGQGGDFSSTGTVAVTVQAEVAASQLSLSAYRFNPDPVRAGEPVTVSIVLTNTGTRVARQGLVTVPVGSGVLIAGPRGATFPFDRIAPGDQITMILPLVVSSEADGGAQSQALQISFFQDTENVQTEVNMTVNVEQASASVLLLDSYDIGTDTVKPGDRFTLSAQLKNVGSNAFRDMLVTFDRTFSAGNEGDTGSTPASNTTFAPINSGGAIFIDSVPAGGSLVEFEQEFIVSGTVASGIYGLPISVRYTNPDGSEGRATFTASVVVLTPPRLRVVVDPNTPPVARVGEPVNIALDVTNLGTRDVNLLAANFTSDAFEFETGDEVLLAALRANETTTVEGVAVALEPGSHQINVILRYLNDLNQEDTLEQTLYFEVTFPRPEPEFTEEPEFPEFPEEPTSEGGLPDDFIGRLLLGLLGLGN